MASSLTKGCGPGRPAIKSTLNNGVLACCLHLLPIQHLQNCSCHGRAHHAMAGHIIPHCFFHLNPGQWFCLQTYIQST